MTVLSRSLTVGALSLFATVAAHAQDKLKIGLISTLSGPPAIIGQQQRAGFNLALKHLGGKLGGIEAELIVQDDELKPDAAVNKVKAMIERDKVTFLSARSFPMSCRRSSNR